MSIDVFMCVYLYWRTNTTCFSEQTHMFCYFVSFPSWRVDNRTYTRALIRRGRRDVFRALKMVSDDFMFGLFRQFWGGPLGPYGGRGAEETILPFYPCQVAQLGIACRTILQCCWTSRAQLGNHGKIAPSNLKVQLWRLLWRFIKLEGSALKVAPKVHPAWGFIQLEA